MSKQSDLFDQVNERLESAENSLGWIDTEVRAVMHDGKSGLSALLMIQAILRDYEETRKA